MLIASQFLESQLKSINPRKFNYYPNRAQPIPVCSRKPVALRAIDSYSGFIPNQIFDKCRPFEQFVYAAVQYLSFHGIKPSCRNIAKHVHLSDKVIKNALYFLRKRQFIVKQSDGSYLFRKLHLAHSTELVDARELVSLHLGYWFPIDVLKSNRISNQAKRAFALILSLIKSGNNQIDMMYIGEKLHLSRERAAQPIASLLSEGLITRTRSHYKQPYSYEIVEKTINYNKNLSTGHTDNRANSDRYYSKGHPDVTSKGHPDVTTLSIKESNISLIDKRKDRRTSDTYKNGKNKDIFFMEEEERRRPDVKYSQAYLTFRKVWGSLHLNCREIGSELSMVERGVM